MNKEYSNRKIINYLRVLNGVSFLVYYVSVLIPSWSDYFGENSGIIPSLFIHHPASPLFMIWDNGLLKLALFILTVFSLLCYTVNFYARFFHIISFILVVCFHLANPFIIHEPQQLNNLLMFMLFFLPIDNNNPYRNSLLNKKSQDIDDQNTNNILNLMQIYIGLYYLFAGLKKLPDLNWLNGHAVSLICSWTYLGKDSLFNSACQNTTMGFTLTYLTLMFELFFLFISFTKYRKYLIIVGIIFHGAIGFSLHVGLFFWSMIMWYPLLLKRKIN